MSPPPPPPRLLLPLRRLIAHHGAPLTDHPALMTLVGISHHEEKPPPQPVQEVPGINIRLVNVDKPLLDQQLHLVVPPLLLRPVLDEAQAVQTADHGYEVAELRVPALYRAYNVFVERDYLQVEVYRRKATLPAPKLGP